MTIRDVNKTFLSRKGKEVEALRGIDIEVREGEVIAVIGPSGCGKSSLLRLLAGLDTVYDGSVDIVAGDSDGELGRLPSATVFQMESTLPWLTVKKNITAVGLSKLAISSAEKSRRADEVLELVGLQGFENAYPHELSGGMRQRVSIARALATRPHLLLMDEPLSALDAQTRVVMQQELLRIWSETRSTVVYITHDIEEAVTLADRVIVLSARPGRIAMVRETPPKTTTDVTELRRDEAFGELVVELWQAVAGSVGSSLSTATIVLD
ncbi:ATP-binding cassette domain-containing protein [Microbacterium pseudoresistens]|uniref:ABC-type nitrate/sulfonate/bicarbonate transport system ATPase subunit n=1 Tax=Microbacterium pseudoresistens TaxID=640634 RepID=A0A7Y9JMX8_9MICO|nr:ABC-type nitrate/sulfonate/bicarbonate transport system ATPase subunit [Microbacterium pseudoresistens]